MRSPRFLIHQVDILKLARARRVIDFEGSMLVMPQHKDVVISLVDNQSVRIAEREAFY
jgi:hypothetical protein